MLRPLIGILRSSLVQIDTEVAEKYANQWYAVSSHSEGRVSALMGLVTLTFGCVSALMGKVTLTFDLLTLKLVCESHLRWETFILNTDMLGLWVLELLCPHPVGGRGH